MASRRTVAALGLVLVAGVLLGGCPATATLVFINQTSDASSNTQVIEIYTTAFGSDDWGPNRLAAPLARGERATFTVPARGRYDILVRHTYIDSSANPQDKMYTKANVVVYANYSYTYLIAEAGIATAKTLDALMKELSQPNP